MSDARDCRLIKNYSERSPDYGEHIKTYTDSNLTDLMMSGLEPLPSSKNQLKAIDLACGKGNSSKHLGEAGMDVHYIDLTEEMIAGGIEEGLIPKTDGRTFYGDVRQLKKVFGEKYHQFFDVAMQRYATHDIEDKPGFFSDVNWILSPGGKFQVTDMFVDESALDPSAVKAALDLYNTYHGWKVKGDSVKIWIVSRDDLIKTFKNSGFGSFRDGRYASKVKSKQWLNENQITEERLDFLNKYFLTAAKKNSDVRDYFNIRKDPEDPDSVMIDFPVIVLTGTKVA